MVEDTSNNALRFFRILRERPNQTATLLTITLILLTVNFIGALSANST